MGQQEIQKKNSNVNRVITISLNQEFFLTKKLFMLLALGLLVLSLSSFEVVSDNDDESNTQHNKTEIIDSEKIEEINQNDIVNTFLDYIPGLREYLFRFKKTDLKKTC